MARVYVGNLDSDVTECDLEDEFCAFGIIRSVWVARRPSGYAFIDFDDHRDTQDAIGELNGKDGWRVELSHNSSGRHGGRSGCSDFECYKCGEPGHFARECHLLVGSQRCQSHTPRSRRSPSNGRRSPSPICLRATQMDSEEQNNQMVELENLAAQLIHCFDRIKKLLLAPPQAEATASASAPKELDICSNGRPVLNDSPSNAPEVVELDPVIPEIVARRKEEKRLAKLEEEVGLLVRSKRMAKTKEKLRLLQGLELPDTLDLSYYAKFKLPETFKMPKFNMYDGSGIPQIHLEHFMMKMAGYAENEPLMIPTFLQSLTGPALRWFFTHRVHMLDTWEEVSDAFLQQYEFNIIFAPTRDDLAQAEMKRGESLRAYAQRWHSLAAQVWPALSDKEMTDLFLRTPPLEDFTRMMWSGCDAFAILVMVGERIEAEIRDGKLAA